MVFKRSRLTNLDPFFDTAVSDAETLAVRGYNLIELARRSTFEEVVYLLLNSELPTPAQYDHFLSDFRSQRKDISPTVHAIRNCFTGAEHPLNVITSCFSQMSSEQGDNLSISQDDLIMQAQKAIATYPMILADHIRKNRGSTCQEDNRPDLNHVANFLYNCFGTTDHYINRLMDIIIIGGSEITLPPSTFVGRVSASARSDFFSSLSAAILTWKGYRHGGASEQACKDLERLLDSGLSIGEYYRQRKESSVPLFGFGHRVYKSGEDPRNNVLQGFAKEIHTRYGGKLLSIADEVTENVATTYDLHPNPDFYCACIFQALGFRAEEVPAVLFMGRIAGISAHIIEENGPKRPMMSPRTIYSGTRLKKYIPINER